MTAVSDYARVQSEIRELEKAQKEEKSEVSNFVLHDCEGKYVGEVNNMNYSVSVRTSEGRSSLDKNAMGADGIDLEKYTTRGDPYTTMTVKIL